MIREIGESTQFPGLIIWGQDPTNCKAMNMNAQKNPPSTPSSKPYSYDWWYEKGRFDRRVLDSPECSRVVPYMDGWESVEDEDRDAHGHTDYMNE